MIKKIKEKDILKCECGSTFFIQSYSIARKKDPIIINKEKTFISGTGFWCIKCGKPLTEIKE